MDFSEKIKEFTEAASDEPLPNAPERMTKEEVYFLTKMVIDELLEFCATVDKPKDVKLNMFKLITDAKDVKLPFYSMNDSEIIAEQADALIDIMYYSGNTAAKKGINLGKIFDIVHQANMNKRDPESGIFLKRKDGKIIKPDNWKEPDVVSEIVRQKKEGAF